MGIFSLLSFLGAAVILTIMPGPDNLFVLAQSIGKGKMSGIYTTLGLCTGLLVHITAATIGITAIFYQSALAFIVVKYAGALYILFLAYKSFNNKGTSISLENNDRLDYKSLYKRGIVMNLLNPKVSLFFLAFLPQFVNHESGNVSLQMFFLGIIFLIQAFAIFSLLSLFAGSIGRFLQNYPSIGKKMNFLEGSLLLFIGLSIAFSQK